MAQSSSGSGIFFQGDEQSRDAGNSHLSSNFGNSSNSFRGHAPDSMDPVSRDVSNMILNSVANSGPSVGASSLVTDANSGHSGGPHLRRSASVNTESYMRMPASPMSFSSNNVSISGSSIMDGSSIVQQSPNGVQVQRSQQHQGASSATSLLRTGQVQLPGTPNSYVQDQTVISHLQKKPRLDIKQEGIQQQVLQQLSQRQTPMLLHNSNPQWQALIQQQRLRQQEQQLINDMPSMQRVQLLQQQQLHQLQLRQQLQVQGLPPISAAKQPLETGGVCSRRLNQYLYHQRQRPAENSMPYWRKFFAEYYAPRAKKRWCLSMYNHARQHSPGVFPQAAMNAWQCDICGAKPGRGFEATAEVLPRLNQIKFGSGVIDELLFVDLPREYRLPSGMMLLEFGKAVEENIYEQLRVVHEGQLRILFTPDLKILSWEFCARRHEELLPRRLVAPQVNQLLQVAQKCQSTISESGADGVSQPDLQANSAMVVTAGRQLARSLELQFLNDLGFSKRFVRCLQIADVVNSMKDLMDFCREQKKGPLEGLKAFPQSGRIQMQKMQEIGLFEGLQGLPADRNTLNRVMTLQHPSHMNNSQHVGGQGSLASMNYQSVLMRQNSLNSTNNSMPQQTSPFGSSSPALSPVTPSSLTTFPTTLQNSPVTGFPNYRVQQPTFQQLLQDISNKNTGVVTPQHPLRAESPAGSISVSNLGPRNAPTTSGTGIGLNVLGQQPNRGNSIQAAASNNESPATALASNKVVFSEKPSDLPQSLPLPDEMVSDIIREFTENGLFNNDLDENMNFNWKA